jgi:hypothetical protein
MPEKSTAPARACASAAKSARKRPEPNPEVLKLKDFLQHLAATGSVSIAAQRAGLERTHVYRKRRTNKAFARGWKEALEIGVEALHDQAMLRAIEGEERPVIRGGEEIATVRRFDNGLLKLLLQAHLPGLTGAPADAGAPDPVELQRHMKAAEERARRHRAQRDKEDAQRAYKGRVRAKARKEGGDGA